MQEHPQHFIFSSIADLVVRIVQGLLDEVIAALAQVTPKLVLVPGKGRLAAAGREGDQRQPQARQHGPGPPESGSRQGWGQVPGRHREGPGNAAAGGRVLSAW